MQKAIITLSWRKKPNDYAYKEKFTRFLNENGVSKITYYNGRLIIVVDKDKRYNLYQILKKSRFAMLLRLEHVKIGERILLR